MTANNILERAAQHMRDRASTYDKPEGERSMGATVAAFQAVTGHRLTEEQGWLFMTLLKAVRSQQGNYRADSYEDGAAYFALAGEAACNERNGGWTPEAIDAAAFKPAPEWPPEDRIDAIGQNGNDVMHYKPELLAPPEYAVIPDWVEWIGVDACGTFDGYDHRPEKHRRIYDSALPGGGRTILWSTYEAQEMRLYKRTPEGFERVLD